MTILGSSICALQQRLELVQLLLSHHHPDLQVTPGLLLEGHHHVSAPEQMQVS